MTSIQEAGQKAAEIARQKVLDRLDKRPSTRLDRAFLRIGQATSAKKTEFFAYQGAVITIKNCIDHQIRLKASDMLINLYNVKPTEKRELSVTLEEVIKKQDEEAN